jgi:hypothetical protein
MMRKQTRNGLERTRPWQLRLQLLVCSLMTTTGSLALILLLLVQAAHLRQGVAPSVQGGINLMQLGLSAAVLVVGR